MTFLESLYFWLAQELVGLLVLVVFIVGLLALVLLSALIDRIKTARRR